MKTKSFSQCLILKFIKIERSFSQLEVMSSLSLDLMPTHKRSNEASLYMFHAGDYNH